MERLKAETNGTREHRLIARIKHWTDERLIGDDCAVLPGRELVTTDMLVEGTHFLRDAISMRELGWKSMAVNLSDIAAMAGRPRYAAISLALPGDVSDAAVEGLYMGFLDCARAYRCRIIGGDLTRGDQIVISVTVLGDIHENGVMLRSGARPGDVVVASGEFGASAAGLWLIKNQVPGFEFCRRKHRRPLPRLCESWSIIRQTEGRGALMDASDGLADALIQIATRSNVAIELDASLIPIVSDTVEVARFAGVDCIDWALYGGEDYELVAALRPDDWLALSKAEHTAFRQIGKVTAGSGVVLQRQDGGNEPLSLKRSFQHW